VLPVFALRETSFSKRPTASEFADLILNAINADVFGVKVASVPAL